MNEHCIESSFQLTPPVMKVKTFSKLSMKAQGNCHIFNFKIEIHIETIFQLTSSVLKMEAFANV